MHDELRRHLLQMLDEDRRVRARLADSGELFQGYAPEMADVHRRNAQELQAIIERVGWPSSTLVGEDGAHAAWVILQHAIGFPELQRRSLRLLEEAAARGKADRAHVAHLEDRICFFERRPQRYGTQFDWDPQGQMSPWLLEDPEHVDDHRRAVGLGPLAESVARIRQETRGTTPPDYEARQAEMVAWARSVGWLQSSRSFLS
jgi:hypothetical protein